MTTPDPDLRSPPSAQDQAAATDIRPQQHAKLGTTLLDGREWEKAPFNTAPWGYCPECGSRTTLREIAPAAKARCLQGHEYWAAMAKPDPSLSRSDEKGAE